MGRAIIKVKPKKYLQQGMRYCGGYTIKAILSAYNLDDGRCPKEYLPLLIKSLGFTLPGDFKKVLQKYGLKVSIQRANKFSNTEKLELLKKELNRNHPVVISIGNGYSPPGKYSSLRRHLIAHWISIWGYDDNKKVFYIYDSYADPKSYDEVPIGNVKRSYDQILRDWRGSIYTRVRSFLYITVKK